MEKPLLSICIPAYNGGEYIEKTINSILSQDFTDFELIIADDKSTDNTAEMISGIKDDRIKYYLNGKNYGFPENWNHCLELACGKYAKIICQDDLLLPGCLSRQVKLLEENENVVMVIGASDVIDSKGNTVMERRLYKEDRLINGRQFARKTLKAARNYYSEHALGMFRLEDKAVYDGSTGYCADWDASMQISYKGDVYFCAQKLAQFRISSGSLSSQMHKERNEKIKKASMALFDKHNELGKFCFSKADRALFSALTDAYSVARQIIIKIKA